MPKGESPLWLEVSIGLRMGGAWRLGFGDVFRIRLTAGIRDGSLGWEGAECGRWTHCINQGESDSHTQSFARPSLQLSASRFRDGSAMKNEKFSDVAGKNDRRSNILFTPR